MDLTRFAESAKSVERKLIECIRCYNDESSSETLTGTDLVNNLQPETGSGATYAATMQALRVPLATRRTVCHATAHKII